MNYTIEYINIDMLKTAEYNRPVDSSHVRHIVGEFDPNRVREVIVNLRKDNYYIIDGQHTVVACKVMGWTRIRCRVFKGLTYTEEAELFVFYNKDPKKLLAFDVVNGLYHAKDDATMAMYECVEAEGMKVGRQWSTNTITAVAALRNIFTRYGIAVLRESLHVIKAVWNGEKDSLQGDLIEGMALLLYTCNTDIDRSRLISKLRTTPVVTIFRAADSDPSGGMKKARIARALLRQYNNQKRDKVADPFVR